VWQVVVGAKRKSRGANKRIKGHQKGGTSVLFTARSLEQKTEEVAKNRHYQEREKNACRGKRGGLDREKTN